MRSRRARAETVDAVTGFVALLRGINVGGRNRLPMADLRAIADDCGFESPHTCLQSGNLVFRAASESESPDRAGDIAKALRAAIHEKAGLDIPVLIRAEATWRALVASCPWPDAARDRDRQVHLGLAGTSAPPGADAALAEYTGDGERVIVLGDAVWIDFAAGVARSKLTSARLDRILGGTVTLRNHRTVLRISALLDDA